MSIADILIKELDMRMVPLRAIDICCGGCNLLNSAKKKWPKLCLVGVDVFDHTGENIDEFHCSDGREFALQSINQYPLVLGNPPFKYLEIIGEYPRLYDELGLNIRTSRLEIEMLLANLRLVANHGILMIILPSTFVEGVRNSTYRKYLAQKFQIEKLIKLPLDAFGSACINSYAVYIKKVQNTRRKATERYHLFGDNTNYQLTKMANIPFELIETGNWEELAQPVEEDFEMRRGNISSQFFEKKGISILHTAKYQKKWEPSIRYVKSLPQSSVFAEKGDIIVNRIGKAAGQWSVYNGERLAITDCLYRIKDYDGKIAETLSGNSYSYQLKGVATRYITKKDFLSWYQTLILS